MRFTLGRLAGEFKKLQAADSNKEDLRIYFLLIFIFIVSRGVAILLLHLKPNDFLLRAFFHLLPLDVLLDRPFEAIWNLHSQPPLYNALLALAVNLTGSPNSQDVVWVMYFFNCTFTIFASIFGFKLVRNLTGVSKPAFIAAFLIVLNPAAFLYETWPLYASLSSCLFLFLANSVERFFAYRGESLFSGFIVILALCAIGLTNSKIPPLAVLILCAFVLRKVTGAKAFRLFQLAPLVIPLLVIMSFQTKNILLFNTYSLSSISGCNLIRVAPVEELNYLAEQGKVFTPFRPITVYRNDISHAIQVPELDLVMKQYGSEEFVNINHRQYPDVCNELGKYAIRAINSNPMNYLENVARNFILYWNSPSQHFSLNQNGNYDKLGPYVRLWEGTIYAGLDVSKYYRPPFTASDQTIALRDSTAKITIFSIAAGALLAYLLILILRKSPKTESYFALALILLGHFAISIMFEIQETARFKFDVEGIYICLLVAAGYKLIRKCDREWPILNRQQQ